jgi:hypothetical protein
VIGVAIVPQAGDLDQQVMDDLRREMRIVCSIVGDETNPTDWNQGFNLSHSFLLSPVLGVYLWDVLSFRSMNQS